MFYIRPIAFHENHQHAIQHMSIEIEYFLCNLRRLLITFEKIAICGHHFEKLIICKRIIFQKSNQLKNKDKNNWAGPQMPTTKNIERQMVSVGDPISQKKATSGFTWEKIPSKTK